MKFLASFAFALFPCMIFAQCPEPSNPVFTSSDVLNWTENGIATLWDVEAGICGFVPTGTPTNTGISSLPFQLPGLLNNVGYEYYVRSDCGSSQSSWVGPALCSYYQWPVVTAWVYCFFPENSSLEWQVHSGPTPSANTGPDSAYSAPDYWYVETTGSSNSDSAIMYSPWLNISGLTDPALTMRYYLHGEDLGTQWPHGGIRIQRFSQSTQTWENFNWLGGDHGPTWHYYAVPINTTDSIIRFRFIGITRSSGTTDFSDMALDNMQIVDAPVSQLCPPPSNPLVVSTTDSTAVLAWTENGTATEWLVHYGPCGFTYGTGTTVYADTIPFTVPNLQSNLPYHFYISSNCGSLGGPAGPIGCSITGLNRTEDGDATPDFQITPNPANDQINLWVDNAKAQLGYMILNAQGASVQTGRLSDKEIDVSELSPGAYFITLTGDEIYETKKLIIAR